MKYFIIFIQIIFISNYAIISGQTLDETFHKPVPYRAARINCVEVLPDGKIMVGGDISHYDMTPVHNLIRLNADGTLDETFSFDSAGYYAIADIEIQSTGEIVILAREFYSLQDELFFSGSAVHKLTADGEIIRTMDSLINVNTIELQDDDMILVGGGEDYYYQNGFLHRYRSDLSTDTLFNNQLYFNNEISDIKFDSNSILISGLFSMIDSSEANNIARLYLDGTIDTSFSTGLGTNMRSSVMTIQNDGKILLGSTYISSYNGIPCSGFIRLNPDGSLDTGFNPPENINASSEIFLHDNYIFVGSTHQDELSHSELLHKLHPNGDADTSFNEIQLDVFGTAKLAIAFDRNDLLLNNSGMEGNIFGFSKYDSTGNLISDFSPAICRYGRIVTGEYFNNKLYLGGDFVRLDDVITRGIASLNINGEVDNTFIFSSSVANVVQISGSSDSTILVSAGRGLLYSSDKGLYRLDMKGNILPQFNYQPFANLYSIEKFIQQNDMKILVYALGTGIYRLNENGSRDNTYHTYNIYTNDFDYDPVNKKIFYVTTNTEDYVTYKNKIVKLDSNGYIDETFGEKEFIADQSVGLIKILRNGEILLGGWIRHFDGLDVPYGLIKLRQDGSIDSLFLINQQSMSAPPTDFLFEKIMQIDDKIYIFGRFFVAVLNIDGTQYSNFNLPFSVNEFSCGIPFEDTYSKSTYIIKGLFTLGTFNIDADPSFIMKMKLYQGVTDIELSDDPSFILLYPNPANESLTLFFPEAKGYVKVYIYDLMGNCVQSDINIENAGEFSIDLSKMTAGTYWLVAISDEGRFTSEKFVKVNR